MEIQIRKLVRGYRVRIKSLECLVQRILEEEGCPHGEVSVTLADDKLLRDLNRRYANKNASTDVLSFPMLVGEPLPLRPTVALGDVVISLETAQRQTPDTLQQEVERLLVHGTLHLFGYDHHSTPSAKKMRERAEHFLER